MRTLELIYRLAELQALGYTRQELVNEAYKHTKNLKTTAAAVNAADARCIAVFDCAA